MERKKELQKRRMRPRSVLSLITAYCTCQQAKERPGSRASFRYPGSEDVPASTAVHCLRLQGRKGEEEQEAESESSDEDVAVRVVITCLRALAHPCPSCQDGGPQDVAALALSFLENSICPVFAELFSSTVEDKKALAFRRLQARKGSCLRAGFQDRVYGVYSML